MSYLCQINVNGKVHCLLVTEKLRLAPLKTVAVPRLLALLVRVLHWYCILSGFESKQGCISGFLMQLHLMIFFTYISSSHSSNT